jgi:hypothetical protein
LHLLAGNSRNDALDPPLRLSVSFLYVTSSRRIFATFPTLSTQPILNLTLAEVESTSDASIATPTEQMASKYTQGSQWKRWLKTAIIALLAATGSAQEVRNSMTSIRDNYGTVPILGGSLEQRFMLRGSRDWPGLVQEQESKKHFSSLPQEKLAARSKQENCGGRKLLAWSEQSRRRNEWFKVRDRIRRSVKKVRIQLPHFEL